MKGSNQHPVQVGITLEAAVFVVAVRAISPENARKKICRTPRKETQDLRIIAQISSGPAVKKRGGTGKMRDPPSDDKCYVAVRVAGTAYLFLVDSGARVSLVPQGCLSGRATGHGRNPSRSVLRSISGALLSTVGQVELPLEIGGQKFNHTVHVADVITPVLGRDFLHKYCKSMDLENKTLRFHNGSHIRMVNGGPQVESAVVEVEPPAPHWQEGRGTPDRIANHGLGVGKTRVHGGRQDSRRT